MESSLHLSSNEGCSCNAFALLNFLFHRQELSEEQEDLMHEHIIECGECQEQFTESLQGSSSVPDVVYEHGCERNGILSNQQILSLIVEGNGEEDCIALKTLQSVLPAPKKNWWQAKLEGYEQRVLEDVAGSEIVMMDLCPGNRKKESMESISHLGNHQMGERKHAPSNLVDPLVQKSFWISENCLLDPPKQAEFLEFLKREQIRKQGHVQFHNGCRNGVYFEFGGSLESESWEELVSWCKEALLPTIKDQRIDFIVGHTKTMYQIGKRLAKAINISEANILEAVGRNPVVVPRFGQELRGRRVFVLVDVVKSGRTLGRLEEVLSNNLEAKAVISAALVNQNRVAMNLGPRLSVCADPADGYLNPCPACASGQKPALYDHTLSRAVESLTREEFDGAWLQSVSYNLWWDRLDLDGALIHNKRLNNAHYKVFIETMRFFENSLTRQRIKNEVCGLLPRELLEEDGVVLYSKCEGERARQVAMLVGEILRWDLCEVKTRGSVVQFGSATVAAIEDNRVILVDAAVNSGATMDALMRIAYGSRAKQLNAFVLINRLAGHPREEFLVDACKGIGGGQFLYCFPFPFIAPKKDEEEVRKFLTTARSLKDKDGLKGYCNWRLRGGKGPGRKRREFDCLALQGIVDCKIQGQPQAIFLEGVTEAGLKAFVRNFPEGWGDSAEIRDSLCSLMMNGIPRNAKTKVAEYLVDIDCFDWLDDSWIIKNVDELRSHQGGSYALAIAAAMKHSPERRKQLVGDLEIAKANIRAERLPFDEQGTVNMDLSERRLDLLLEVAEDLGENVL